MCWSCNPICGGCRPPRKRAVKCPSCNTFNIFDIEKRMSKKVCKSCGMDLTDQAIPEPLQCNYCGEICYNPCKKAKETPKEGFLACMIRVSEPIIRE